MINIQTEIGEKLFTVSAAYLLFYVLRKPLSTWCYFLPVILHHKLHINYHQNYVKLATNKITVIRGGNACVFH